MVGHHPRYHQTQLHLYAVGLCNSGTPSQFRLNHVILIAILSQETNHISLKVTSVSSYEIMGDLEQISCEERVTQTHKSLSLLTGKCLQNRLLTLQIVKLDDQDENFLAMRNGFWGRQTFLESIIFYLS